MNRLSPPRKWQKTLALLYKKEEALRIQLSGHGTVAQGTGAKAVGEGGVLVEGSVRGNIITGDRNQVGGIQAETIKAENVVQGMQQIGGDLSVAAEAVALAEALRGGTITADSIEAQNVVAGWQYIADPANVTPDELRQQVAELQRQLAAALAEGEVEANADVEDVQYALYQAETELEKPQPHGRRIVRRLQEAADILIDGAKSVDAARQVGVALLRLAPIAAALSQTATTLFGG